jgi:hypothetical protein
MARRHSARPRGRRPLPRTEGENTMSHSKSERDVFAFMIVSMINKFNRTDTDKMLMIGVIATAMIQSLYEDSKDQMVMAKAMAKGIVKATEEIQKENKK